jgi:acetate kinase
MLIDDELISGIESLDELAPLHNASAAAVSRGSRSTVEPPMPQIAVFDTASSRFGFHGISHNYLVLRYAELSGTPLEQTNIITLRLEGDSSATAVVSGKSSQTSMGFTPLEGLNDGNTFWKPGPGAGRISRSQGEDQF